MNFADVPPGLAPAREQMALSLGWHIVIACFGVAFPAMIWVVHRHGIRNDDPVALGIAKRWSKVAAVLFALGAVSGTVLSFEMGLLWPGLMGRFGDVLGLPFAVEGLAFFVEAIFLGIYLFGWGRLPARTHLRTLLPVAAAGVVGAYSVVAVNAWMNNPTGFTLDSAGNVTDVRPMRVLFNRMAVLQFAHMWVGAFMLVGFVIASVYAVGIRRGRSDTHHRLGFVVPFAFASVAAIAQPFIGHVTGSRLVNDQPSKLAAIELAPTSRANAPLLIGGVLVDGRVRFGIDIPRLGSVVATNSFHGTVPGIDGDAPADRPNANVVHLAFQTMVGLGTALAAFGVLFVVRWRRGRDLFGRWAMRGAVAAGPAAVVALEAGWITSEVGRQPWIVFRILRVRDAASTASGLWWSLAAMAVVYGAMTFFGVQVLRSMARRWREGTSIDLPTPYGPRDSQRADNGPTP
jgi:cytochrome bd ubiquinol oxidase subunit I